MRQTVGEKRLKRYRRETGLDVLAALVRGNTDHRIDLCIADGSVMHWYRDGRLEKSSIGWNVERWRAKQAAAANA